MSGTPNITDEMWKEIRRFVWDEHVHDLGAGDLSIAHELRKLGAAKVTAVDRHEMPVPKYDNIERVRAYFKDYNRMVASIDMALISFPVNWPTWLPVLAQKSKYVIYLGCNNDFTMCAEPIFWKTMIQRKVLAHVPTRPLTMIIYGEDLYEERPLLPEEGASLNNEKSWTFEDAQKAFPV